MYEYYYTGVYNSILDKTVYALIISINGSIYLHYFSDLYSLLEYSDYLLRMHCKSCSDIHFNSELQNIASDAISTISNSPVLYSNIKTHQIYIGA